MPVRNDRAGLAELLSALAAQTKPPDEVLVVDGGSTDGTLEEVEGWSGAPLRLLVEPDATIAAARNAGISAAAHEWIACTDAGCRPAPGWLAAIDGARRDADFIAGVVVVDGETPLERTLALTHYPSTDELERAGPLVRVSQLLFGRRYESDRVGGGYMAFTRAAWRAVGGFPEDLDAGEDRAFSSAIVARGLRTLRVPEAAVHWRPPPTWRGNVRMFMRYSRGDVRIAGRGRHAARACAWGWGCSVFLRGGRWERASLAAGSLAYMALPAWRAQRAGLPARHWWRIPVAVAVKDLSQIAGAALGLADAMPGRRRQQRYRRQA